MKNENTSSTCRPATPPSASTRRSCSPRAPRRWASTPPCTTSAWASRAQAGRGREDAARAASPASPRCSRRPSRWASPCTSARRPSRCSAGRRSSSSTASRSSARDAQRPGARRRRHDVVLRPCVTWRPSFRRSRPTTSYLRRLPVVQARRPARRRGHAAVLRRHGVRQRRLAARAWATRPRRRSRRRGPGSPRFFGARAAGDRLHVRRHRGHQPRASSATRSATAARATT